jgi:hypothetical protein
VAVYSRRTGEVVHTHHEAADGPDAAPHDDERLRLALELASRLLGVHSAELDAVAVDASTDLRGGTYRVDLASGSLIETRAAPDPVGRLRELGTEQLAFEDAVSRAVHIVFAARTDHRKKRREELQRELEEKRTEAAELNRELADERDASFWRKVGSMFGEIAEAEIAAVAESHPALLKAARRKKNDDPLVLALKWRAGGSGLFYRVHEDIGSVEWQIADRWPGSEGWTSVPREDLLSSHSLIESHILSFLECWPGSGAPLSHGA